MDSFIAAFAAFVSLLCICMAVREAWGNRPKSLKAELAAERSVAAQATEVAQEAAKQAAYQKWRVVAVADFCLFWAGQGFGVYPTQTGVVVCHGEYSGQPVTVTLSASDKVTASNGAYLPKHLWEHFSQAQQDGWTRKINTRQAMLAKVRGGRKPAAPVQAQAPVVAQSQAYDPNDDPGYWASFEQSA